jgi:hypothetical protein
MFDAGGLNGVPQRRAINKTMRSSQTIRLGSSLFVILLLASVLPAGAAGITWTNSSGGNWNSADNWSPNQVPGASDTAVFSTPGTYTVGISDNESVSNLDLGDTSGTLTLSISDGTFTVNGTGSDSA